MHMNQPKQTTGHPRVLIYWYQTKEFFNIKKKKERTDTIKNLKKKSYLNA